MQIDYQFFTDVFLPVAGIICSVVIYFFQKSKKKISYRIVSVESLPSYDKPVSEIQNPDRKIIIEYNNAGNTPLQTADFYRPVKTNFVGAKIKQVETNVYAFSEKFSIDISYQNSVCSFTPELMNSDDSMYVSYIIEDFKRKIYVETKIIGGYPVINKELINFFNTILAIIVGAASGVLLNNNPDFKKLGFGLNTKTLLILTPYLIYMIYKIRKIAKDQFGYFFIWDIKS
jgi:hypothetical protein